MDTNSTLCGVTFMSLSMNFQYTGRVCIYVYLYILVAIGRYKRPTLTALQTLKSQRLIL